MKKLSKGLMDFSLIWKKLNNIISVEEETVLSAWLKESPENMWFFYKVKEFDISKSKDNTHKSWEVITLNLKSKRRNRLIVYSMAACLALIVTVGLYFLKYNSALHDIETVSSIPASNVTTLMLSDGTNVELDSENELILNEAGATIESKGTSLIYTSKNKKPNKLVYNTINVPRGGEFFMHLSDSTKVWINSETRMRYPTNFSHNERVVEVYGEAYFEVHSNDSKPFRVISGKQVVNVTGTSFNISTFGSNNTVVTTLVEGEVQISSLKNNKILALLEPGNQAIFDNENQVISVSEVNTSMFTSWINGYYYFQNESIENIIKTLARWYNLDIEVHNNNILSLRFTGKLKRTESFQQILSKIEKTNEINFYVDGNKVVIE